MAGWVRRCLAPSVTGLVSTLVLTGVASAATIPVTDPTDTALSNPNATACPHPQCTLREAVQAADNLGGASTITLPVGTYQLSIASTGTADPTNGDLDVAANASITINGAGSGTTIIDANQIDRAFAVQDGASLSLSGVTIENGQPSSASTGAQAGGAIYSNGNLTATGDVTFTNNASPNHGGAIATANGARSTLSLTGATFEGNAAPSGGAVYNDLSGVATATIANAVFTANGAGTSSSDSGGAVYGFGGSLTVTDSRFTDNAAGTGGALLSNSTNAQVQVTGSSFIGNFAGQGGGAINDTLSANVSLSHDDFGSNSSRVDGGALDLHAIPGTTYALDHDEFDANTAGGSGGAINADAGTLTAASTSFAHNTAGGDGGALYTAAGAPLTLVNVTASDNSAAAGGALFLQVFTPVTMTNDTITANTATVGQGGGVGKAQVATASSAAGVRNTIIAENTGGDCNATFVAAVDSGHNLDGDRSCLGGLGGAGDTPGGDPLLGAPADNGGTVLTDAPAPDSPAVDAGTNAGCPTTDARDVSRPQGSACDMGAFEAPALSLALGDSAPASVTAGNPYSDTVTASRRGSGVSTNTTVTDQLPAGTTLYGVDSSQGTCTSSGSPAQVSCNLGTLSSGTTGTVTITVAAGQPGSITNTATAANDQGVSTSASATTQVTQASPAPSLSAPTAVTAGATGLTPTRATLLGRVTTGGQRTAYFFQYGSSHSYGEATPVQATGTATAARALITGLTAGHTYHYRVVAINSSGVAYGSDRTVTAPLPKPSVGLTAKPTQARRLPYRFTLAGTLRLPRGITRARGCRGTITVTVRNGRRRLISRSARVNRRCQYTARITVTKRPGTQASGRLSATAVFGGNPALGRSQSQRIGLRYG